MRLNWMLSAILISLLGHSMCEDKVFDRCWAGRDLASERSAQKYALCPLVRDNEENSTKFSCGINFFTGYSMERANEVCRRCLWKSHVKAVCYPSANYNMQECCCQRPMCNKQLYEDAMPGWDLRDGRFKASELKGTCVSANFVYDAPPEKQWKHLDFKLDCKHAVSPENSNQCGIHITKSNDSRLVSLQLGCAQDLCKGNDAKARRFKSVFKSYVCYELFDDKTNNTQYSCCCPGDACNAKLYRGIGFKHVAQRRYEEEEEYLQLLKSARKIVPTKWWSKNKDYLAWKPYIDGAVMLFCVFFSLLIIFIYQYHQPIYLEKRAARNEMSKDL